MRISLHALALSMILTADVRAAEFYTFDLSSLEKVLQESKEEGQDKKVELIEAVKNGDCNKVRFFVEDDSLPIDEMLHLAIVSEQNGVTELLLQHNVPVNKKFEGYTPLMVAATIGNETMIVRLLDADAYLHAIDKYGNTAFHIACFEGHFKAAMVLKKRGASLVARNLKGMTPFHRAAFGGNTDIIRKLLGEAERDTQDDSGATPLMIALYKHNKDATLMMIEAGVRHDLPDHNGYTPLHLAAVRGIDLVKALLKQNANPRVSDKEKMTPLHLAASVGNPEIVEVLIPNSELDAKDFQENSPLLIALGRKHESAGLMLLDKGARTDLAGAFGFTPLHLAALRDLRKAMKILLEKGADPLARDKRNRLPLNLTQNKEIRHHLVDAIRARQQT